MLEKFLDDEALASLRTELGIGDDKRDDQVELLARLGTVILQRILLELAKRMSEQELVEYRKLVASEKYEELHSFLAEHIPDLDAFVQGVAQKELETIKARARELSGK